MPEYDLIIAGAGPAGCALAAKVARAGYGVMLLEKEREVGDSRDWIVDVENSAFEAAGVPMPVNEALFEGEAERTVMVSPNGAHEIDLIRAPLTQVRNGKYVKQLLEWARESGAEVRCGCAVREMILKDQAVSGVAYEEGNQTSLADSRLVADCTGIQGVLRSAAPESWALSDPVGIDETVLAQREVRAVDARLAERAIEKGKIENGVRTERMGALGTYSVETRYLDLAAGFIDILIGIKPSPVLPTPEERLLEIIKELPFIGEVIFGGGAPIPIRRPLNSLVGDGFMVLGDSACHTIPVHGSGVASALIAADIAARTATRAIGEGRFDRASLWEYCHTFQSERGPVLAYYDVLRKFTDKVSDRDLDFLIRSGVLTAEEVFSGLVPEPFVPSPSILFSKVCRGAARIGLLARFAKVGLRAQRVMKKFERYPPRFSQDALDSWIARVSSY